jgi:hypothetical protein
MCNGSPLLEETRPLDIRTPDITSGPRAIRPKGRGKAATDSNNNSSAGLPRKVELNNANNLFALLDVASQEFLGQ